MPESTLPDLGREDRVEVSIETLGDVLADPGRSREEMQWWAHKIPKIWIKIWVKNLAGNSARIWARLQARICWPAPGQPGGRRLASFSARRCSARVPASSRASASFP